MQKVSQEWKDNQKSVIRRPGFVVIDLPNVPFLLDTFSYRKVRDNVGIKYVSDRTGCEYLDKCILFVGFTYESIATLGDDTVTVTTYDSRDNQIETFDITKETLNYEIFISRVVKGFSYVHITCKKDVVTTIRLSSYGIPRTEISVFEHSRSYDPMGFELPTNSVTIDVYNYGDKYTDFCKNYAGQEYPIKVRYGYELESGTEIINGGEFTMTDVTMSDSMLTIIGDNLLTQIDEKLQMNIFDLKGTTNSDGTVGIKIPISDNASVKTFYLGDRAELSITPLDILTYLRYTGGISITWDNAQYISNATINTAINAPYIELLQSIVNFTLNRCYINRQNTLVYTSVKPSVADGEDILMLNSFEKPVYSCTKQIKSFEINDVVYGESQVISEETSGDEEVKDYRGKVDMDCQSNKLWWVDVEWYGDMKGMYYVIVTPDTVWVYYRNNGKYKEQRGMAVTYSSFEDKVITTSVNDIGTICDINSLLGRPVDTDKIVNYFSNRDLYTFNVRGNPARDVGDYINVSLTNDNDTSTYKKGLVLSSTLSYNGSFKEEVTVRIIENEFEGETENANNV